MNVRWSRVSSHRMRFGRYISHAMDYTDHSGVLQSVLEETSSAVLSANIQWEKTPQVTPGNAKSCGVILG